MSELAAEPSRLRTWQGITVATLFVGYAGYYVCRSVLPVASNAMLNDPELGFDEAAYGRLIAIGTYAYAIGKLVNGVATEYFGGRRMFLLGMVLSAICVAAFGVVGSASLLLILWAANRFVQSMGWVSMVQIIVRWFHPTKLATIMGIVSLSYLFGDALGRLYLGAFASAGATWPQLFGIASVTLLTLAIVGVFTLKSSPLAIGAIETSPPTHNVHGADDGRGTVSLFALLGPLVRSPMFLLVCLMNAGLTSIRETFNFWTPRYLEKGVGLDPDICGLLSFLFPFVGAIASLLAGWGADRLRGHFGKIIVALVMLTMLALFALVNIDLHNRSVLALTLISAVALFVMGPCTYCSGVLAMNLGGRRAAAASAGIIDAVGYLCGAIVSGEIAGPLVKQQGFAPLLQLLAWLAAATLVVAVVYWRLEERRFRQKM